MNGMQKIDNSNFVTPTNTVQLSRDQLVTVAKELNKRLADNKKTPEEVQAEVQRAYDGKNL